MLKSTQENLHNADVVEKIQVSMLCFSKEASQRIQEINDKLAEAEEQIINGFLK